MKRNNNDKVRGEILVTQLSDKAQKFYSETFPLDVYQTIDGEIYVYFCDTVFRFSSVNELNEYFELISE